MDEDPRKARYLRKQKRVMEQQGIFEDEELDDDFLENPRAALLKLQEKDGKEEDEAKKVKEQMDFFGYRVEPLNMRRELEFGQVGRDSGYVIDKERVQAARDPWLDQLDEIKYDENFDFERVRKSKEAQERCLAEKDEEPPLDIVQLKQKLCDLLLPEETATKALNRLRPAQPTMKKTGKNVRKKVKLNEEDEKAAEEKRKETEMKAETDRRAFDELVSTCTALQKLGYIDVYTDTLETILNSLPRRQQPETKEEPAVPAKINIADELKDDLEDL
eukprot:TRINITY_DN12553_c0_g2_i1.p1 TRINITY_DN12553_c0_g2~~TRINITY_DN12553_c0_g2_i1.p1  ORF type:complete len:275 (+),score=81.88 TRINITY_DN12553_c0_g2_i1:135-959(+)